MRSTMISRCSSPMPEMMVWPDSWSVLHAERRVFLREALQREAHLLLVALGLRLDRDRDHGLRELHLLERDDAVRVAQRVARGHVLQADGRGDVAGADFLDLLALVGVHLQQAADALLLAPGRHEHLVARVEHARVDAEERQVADERVVQDLERERGELRVVARRARGFLAVARRCPSRPASRPATGMYSMTASSIACTPLFLNAEPHSVMHDLVA